MKKFNISKGFTLIELLIVITIIGILAVALLPSVLGAPARARDAARKADMNNIIAALETFNSDHQHYPDDAKTCIDGLKDASGVNGTNVLATYFNAATPPKDPQGKGPGNCATTYEYSAGNGNPVSYALAAYMEVGGDANVAWADVSAAFETAPIGTAEASTLKDKITADAGKSTNDTYIVLK